MQEEMEDAIAEDGKKLGDALNEGRDKQTDLTRRQGRTVLVADGNPATRATAQALLEAEGHVFQGAGDGLEALCRLADGTPDFAFIARDCPRLDGFQFCALLQAREEYRHLPVVLLGEAEDIFEQARAELLGAAGVLGKPFSREELLAFLAPPTPTHAAGKETDD